MLNLLLTLCRVMCNLSVLALQLVPFVPARPDGTLLASVLPRLEHKPESSEHITVIRVEWLHVNLLSQF